MEDIYEAVLEHTGNHGTSENILLADTSATDITGSLGVWGIEQDDTIY